MRVKLNALKLRLLIRSAMILATLSLLHLDPAAAVGQTRAPTYPSSAGPLKVESVVTGLESPWGFTFLPNNRVLITEKTARMRVVSLDGSLSFVVKGLPPVWIAGQGGLLDVLADKDFVSNSTIYFCFVERDGRGGRTAVASARLVPRPQLLTAILDDLKIIFREIGPPSSGNNLGCRLAQDGRGYLYASMGDHEHYREHAQDLMSHLGKIIRITTTGSSPGDNPFARRRDALPEIWSYGHHNVQGLTFDVDTGELWASEHGPRGGDEINRIYPGKNYGWPVIGFGVNYNGTIIHDSTSKPGMEQPLKYWETAIAPSGMTMYKGDMFPMWKGSLFIGGLATRTLIRLPVRNGAILAEERLLDSMRARIRDVRQGPDGALWILTDQAPGSLLRITPAGR